MSYLDLIYGLHLGLEMYTGISGRSKTIAQEYRILNSGQYSNIHYVIGFFDA